MAAKSRSFASFAPALREAAIAGFVAALLSVPLLGFRLVDSAQGLSLDYRFLWVVYASVGVFSGRLILSLTGSSIVESAQKSFSRITIFKRFNGNWERITGWALIGLALVLPLFADRGQATERWLAAEETPCDAESKKHGMDEAQSSFATLESIGSNLKVRSKSSQETRSRVGKRVQITGTPTLREALRGPFRSCAALLIQL